jgi:Kinesin motor domain
MSKQGIVPRSLELIFQKIEELKQAGLDAIGTDPKIDYKVRLTFVQLYNEKIFDMMDTDDYFLEHKLRYNARDMFFVEGVNSSTVKSTREAM